MKLYFLIAGILMSGITCLKAQDADDILQKHIQAIGGAENWDKIKTMKATGIDKYMGAQVELTNTLVTGKALRMDMVLGGYPTYQVLTINKGWVGFPYSDKDKVDTVVEENAYSYLPILNMKRSQFIDYKTTGFKAAYAGKDTIDARPCYKIKLTDKKDNVYIAFIEEATWYLLRTERTIKKDDDEKDFPIDYDNYKKLDAGITMPMSYRTINGAIEMKKIEVNQPVDESIFAHLVQKK